MKTVIFIPGIWMPAFTTHFLREQVAHCGYEVRSFGYASVLDSWQENIDTLYHFIAHYDRPVVLVGHSLGGLLSAAVVNQHPHLNVEQIIMLGSPIAGSRAGRALSRRGIGRRMMGGSCDILYKGLEQLPKSIPVRMIAGQSRFGLGRVLTRLPYPHDGTVAVEETRLEGLADHVILPVNHTGMLFSRPVVRAICHYLAAPVLTG